MILLVYLIIKMLVKTILIDLKFSPNMNSSIKKNFKMIASIYYHSTLDLIKDTCPIIRSKQEIGLEDNDHIVRQHIFKKNLYEAKSNIVGKIDPSYIEACKKIYQNKRADENDLTYLDEEKLFNRINKKLTHYTPDTKQDDIESISTHLYTAEELRGYNILAEANNFSIKDKIKEFSDKLLEIINSQDTNNNNIAI